MVSGTLRKQITVSLFAALLGLLILIESKPAHEAPVYNASDPSFDLEVLNGIGKAKSNSVDLGAKAVIVPHHLVASKSIALGIKALAASSPKVVVIISPDHFAHCSKMLCTSKGSFISFFGTTTISSRDVEDLERHTSLVEDSNLFIEEHGVYTIVPFIKHYIPDSEVVPIAISQRGRGSEEMRAEIITILAQLLSREDVVLVISSDFSHYLPLAQSNKMDVKTKNSFCTGNSGELLKLSNPDQSDCPLCLWIAQVEAVKLGFWNPRLVAHTNSAVLLHDTSVQETTSHFTFTLSTHPISREECFTP